MKYFEIILSFQNPLCQSVCVCVCVWKFLQEDNLSFYMFFPYTPYTEYKKELVKK